MRTRLARLLRRTANKLDRQATQVHITLDGKQVQDALLRFRRQGGLG